MDSCIISGVGKTALIESLPFDIMEVTSNYIATIYYQKGLSSKI